MMTNSSQEAIRAKCFHPSGNFVEFKQDEIEQSIPDRFEEIVRRYPDRIAVKTGDRVVTYNELNAMANRVACAILAQQGPESEPVGLLVEKDARLMAAMLGVLKAGKFFVLLDPSFPQPRIAALLADSQPKVVIVGRHSAVLAREAAGDLYQSMEFDSIDCDASPDNLRLALSPEASTCLLYTSGSTGRPKGTLQNHRTMLSKVRDYTNLYHVCMEDRFSLLASGTSNSVVNAFVALLQGAALLPFDVQRDGVLPLSRWLSQERISLSWISSPLFRNLAETLTEKETFPHLRLIRLTSEAAYKTDVDLYKKRFSPDCILASGMASSETGPLSEYFIDHQTEIPDSKLPVGYTVEGKEILLLDDTGNEIHPGEIGEIAVRGSALFSGYWREPELSASKFKSDPQNPAERLYLTGDLALRLPDGCLVHKGRKDFRVKIRGYGVELAEVEKALLTHPVVREAVVTTQENPSGETRLIAYFTSVHAPTPMVSDLFRYLKEKLPDYMIPTALVRLDALPLTSNGKIDRSALPAPGTSRPELDTPFALPQTTAEETLAEIWAEVLGLDRIGIHDNFFELGGYSLLATRVLSRILDRFQVELPLSQFFMVPTIAALAAHIETADSPRNEVKLGSIKPFSRERPLVLSSAQQRLWFLDQLEPGSSAYNLSSAIRLIGRLDVTALQQSFKEIVRRHEVLRTVFKAIDGEPVQIILPSLTLELPVVDLREVVSHTEREQEAHRLCVADAQRPFDLSRGPLLRITLVRLSETEHILLRTTHHIVFDGWSSTILAQEVAAFYDAFSNGTLPSLPELPIQYADFAQWQRQRTQGDETGIAYWKKQLENLPTLHLPTDRPRPPVQTAHGEREYFALSESLSADLKSLSNRHGVTLFMTLLAAYHTLLHRYTGQIDIVIGTPVAGRNRSQTEGLIGFFLNMLVLRADLSGNPTFRELLRRVREVCLEGYAHQEVPFERLVKGLQPERDLSRNPLFQAAFVFQNTTLFPLELPGLATKEFEFDSGITRFDLRLFMMEEGDRLRGWIDYNADLFDKTTMPRLLSHWQTLLEGIVANSDERIARLPLLTEPDRRKLLIEWNNTRQDYPRDKCIHELFEAQVEQTPGAVAAIFEDRQLTYRDLNAEANRLARYLQKLGVAPGLPVGICVERSLEMLVGVLGILKAGGAYVSLDPTYPKERLAFIVEDMGVRVLLTRKHLRANLPEYSGQMIFLDRESAVFVEENDSNLPAASDAGHLAYVVYTSGSTGKPKGVLSHHRGVVNYLSYIRQTYHLNDTDVVLQLPSLSFDASVRDLIGPLTAGAQVVLVNDAAAKDPTALLSKISEHHVTCLLSVVPTMLNGLINAPSGDGPPYDSVRLILVSGEALQLSAHTKAKEVFGGGLLLVNQYGPTECTMTSTYWPVQTSGHRREALIGNPIPNAQIFILDGDLQPVPIGVVGRIYIGGYGLAWGYLNRPDLTAETFVPNPFGDHRGTRLYSTGDLGRYLPGGNIEFLGRSDNQVKIRGFRIELGEIEAVLTRHPAVSQAVVVAREDVPGENRLVAYVVSSTEEAPRRSELQSFLKSLLPDYMAPSAFVILDSLPLTPNGKVDRRALPAPDQNRPEFQDTFVRPATPEQISIAGIWAEVLSVTRIGIHDNFFDLGGHSLLATRVVSRLREALSIELPLRALFEAPTVAGIAAFVERIKEHGPDNVPKIAPISRDSQRVKLPV